MALAGFVGFLEDRFAGIFAPVLAVNPVGGCPRRLEVLLGPVAEGRLEWVGKGAIHIRGFEKKPRRAGRIEGGEPLVKLAMKPEIFVGWGGQIERDRKLAVLSEEAVERRQLGIRRVRMQPGGGGI